MSDYWLKGDSMDTQINQMFSNIYKKYDFMNHFFSFNFDKGWREEAAGEAMVSKKEYKVLDVATGTGDLAIALNERARACGKDISIIGTDPNKEMLSLAKGKIQERGIKNVSIAIGDGTKMKYGPGSFDVVTTGFAMRSIAFSKGGWKNIEKFLSESHRVLKKNGKIVILDMALPDDKAEEIFFRLYSIPMNLVGSFVNKEAYDWLIYTIKTFDKKRLIQMMKKAGFTKVRMRELRSGIAFVAVAEK